VFKIHYPAVHLNTSKRLIGSYLRLFPTILVKRQKEVHDSLSSNNTPSGGITVAEGWLSYTTQNGSCLFLFFFLTTMTEQKIFEEW